MPALWKRTFSDGSIHLVLQYSDDFLSAATSPTYHLKFKEALESRFSIEWPPRADRYMQARIQQVKEGNIYLDQQRYSKAVVKRYIPTASLMPTDNDKSQYASPLPTNFNFSSAGSQIKRPKICQILGNTNYFLPY
jgi:hypothetical protein